MGRGLEGPDSFKGMSRRKCARKIRSKRENELSIVHRRRVENKRNVEVYRKKI